MISRDSYMGSEPIDAVVTWVDGADPRHQLKRRLAMQPCGDASSNWIPAGAAPTRFADNNEVEFCLRLIRKFAPWIRTIFLVTDEQRPAFLTAEEQGRLGVELIDHSQIFEGYEAILPTFNSLTIESVLYRIPGLAERFIYFNDDVFLLRHVDPEDFFIGDRVVLRGEWRRLPKFGPARLAVSSALNVIAKRVFGIDRAMSVLQQIRAAQLAGMRETFFKVVHTPHPMRRETLRRFWDKNPRELARNIRYKFRNLDQVATTGLANHLEIQASNVDLRSPNDAMMVCFHRESKDVIAKKLEALSGRRVKYFCVQSLDQASPFQKERVAESLRWATEEGDD